MAIAGPLKEKADIYTNRYRKAKCEQENMNAKTEILDFLFSFKPVIYSHGEVTTRGF